MTTTAALASPERAGRRVHDEVRREQRAFVRRNWTWLALIVGLFLAPNASSLFFGSPFADGLLLGITGASAAFAFITAVVLSTGTAPRMMGGEAEKFTAEELAAIQRHGYRVIHHSGFGKGDIDHVLVGPGGLFVIETKWSSLDWNLDSPSSVINAALGQVRREARRMAHVTRPFGEPKVTPVLVVWGPAMRGLLAQRSPVRRLPDGTLVLPGVELEAWSLRLGRGSLDERQVEQIWGRLAEHTAARDALEPSGPRSLGSLVREMAKVIGTAVAALCTAYLLVLAPLGIDLAISVTGTFAALALRRIPGWRVAGTAAVVVETFYLLLVVFDLISAAL